MMGARRVSKVINIGSIDGTGIALGISNYAVSKMGLIQLTCSEALELVPYGIKVNFVSPGSIATGMTPAEEGKAEYDRFLERIRQIINAPSSRLYHSHR